VTYPIFYDEGYSGENTWEISNSEKDHILKSFRMKMGEKLFLSNGAGIKCEAEIIRTSPLVISTSNSRHCEGAERLWQSTQSAVPRINVVQGITKHENKDTVEMLAELGIKSYIPWKSNRSIKIPDPEKLVKSYTNQAIIGSKIARSAYLPKVLEPMTTKQLLKVIGKSKCIVFYEDADFVNSPSFGRGGTFGDGVVNNGAATNPGPEEEQYLILGPEGGITPEEIQLFQQQGYEIASLGERVLSSKVAAVSAVNKANF
jgi:16S rRNA (uracil1498-N3)-methyltransferase